MEKPAGLGGLIFSLYIHFSNPELIVCQNQLCFFSLECVGWKISLGWGLDKLLPQRRKGYPPRRHVRFYRLRIRSGAALDLGGYFAEVGEDVAQGRGVGSAFSECEIEAFIVLEEAIIGCICCRIWGECFVGEAHL
jgi:hypothetical protein